MFIHLLHRSLEENVAIKNQFCCVTLHYTTLFSLSFRLEEFKIAYIVYSGLLFFSKFFHPLPYCVWSPVL